MTRLTRIRLRLFATLTLLTMLVGVLDGYLGNNIAEASMAGDMLRGGVTYLIGGSFIWGFEILFVQSRYGSSIRRMYFLTAIAVKSITLLLIIIFVGTLDQSFISGQLEFNFLDDPNFLRTVSFVFAFIIALQTVTQIVRIVGGRTLINFILGKYHRPVHEEKIFMFLDMVGSTTLAERLGDVGVQSMITKFFFDITEPIVEHGGEIHRYVGDEVIVTWPITKGAANMRSIRCCLAIADKVRNIAQEYEREFDAVPAFRIGLHGGPVVISQCGDQKQEISYFGDTINTASRVEQQCKVQDCNFLITAELLDRVTLPPTFRAISKGAVQLRGREKDTELFTVVRDA